ncbi:MAG: bifunctional diguanylate cyclase/phosphodiesterase [Synechococcaceae cyanobacterium]|nr:bifunctional diguanylate cyclase/phosphodiesterase [Synechococcaceae cyanobacterium]
MSEVPWSLHLLSEVLSAFSVEDPNALGNVIIRIAEAVDAEVAAVVRGGRLQNAIGVIGAEQELLVEASRQRPAAIELQAGHLHTYWAPLAEGDQLVVGRLGEPFTLEERSLLRAMGRAILLCSQVLDALAAERGARSLAEQQATHDSMTGLPNRIVVLEQLGRELKRFSDLGGPVPTVLFIDLDRFKLVNDAHGHAIGDQFLIGVADLLRSVVRQPDLVGRLAGDEFVVVTCTCDPEEARLLAKRLIQVVGQPLSVSGRLISHAASIGIAFADPQDSAESLIENADMAMYRAKEKGRGCFFSYDSALRQMARLRATTEADLRRGLAAGELTCWYQPIVHCSEGRIIGFEALVRWRHPEHGLVAPAAFIPVAEEMGLIAEIDALVLDQACRELARWPCPDPARPITLSVNVSARSFLDPQLAERVALALQISGLDASRIYLEITETMLVADLDATLLAVEKLNALGIRLAIDDFGTGYSSLRYLKRFPVGLLKIDRSFTDGLGIDREDEAIVEAVIDMTSALEIGVIAEGVERAEQAGILARLGCQLHQGFLYSRPLEAAAVAELLSGSRELAPSALAPPRLD